MSITASLLMIMVGAMLGFLSGVFGVGGSSVATPLLRLLNVPRLFALATPLPVTLPTALIGGWTYWRQGKVNARAALWTAAGGVPAVVAGSLLTLRAPGRLLMALTGAFVVVVGVRLLWKPVIAEAARNTDAPAPAAPIAISKLLLVGVGVGFMSGLLANGGGFLLVPAYLLLFAMTAQEAAATSLVAVALLALPGTWVHWRLGHINAHLALLLGIGVIPATYVGARVGMTLDERKGRLAFGVFLFVFGLFFLIRTLLRAELYGWLT